MWGWKAVSLGILPKMSSPNRANAFLLHDVLIIVTSITVAVILVQTESLVRILGSTQEFKLFGSLVAGLFFTSIFTTAPAIVTLGEIARIHAIVPTALFGAVGAVIGDLVIFRFVRDKFSEHLVELVGHRNIGRRIHTLFKRRLFRWVSLFVGGFIIASPLPDELGISVFGFSKMKTSKFIILSFFFNFVGIVLIGLVARAL